jgi:hypothetical protein
LFYERFIGPRGSGMHLIVGILLLGALIFFLYNSPERELRRRDREETRRLGEKYEEAIRQIDESSRRTAETQRADGKSPR